MPNLLNPAEFHPTERMRLASGVHLQALAAICGYQYIETKSDFDSIDALIKSKTGRRAQIEFQLKCTGKPTGSGAEFPFPVPIKNYRDLTIEDPICPRYLGIVVTPSDFHHWLRLSEKRLNLRHCLYWSSLRGLPKSANIDSVTVRIQRTNLLTPEALSELMSRPLISPASANATLEPQSES